MFKGKVNAKMPQRNKPEMPVCRCVAWRRRRRSTQRQRPVPERPSTHACPPRSCLQKVKEECPQVPNGRVEGRKRLRRTVGTRPSGQQPTPSSTNETSNGRGGGARTQPTSKPFCAHKICPFKGSRRKPAEKNSMGPYTQPPSSIPQPAAASPAAQQRRQHAHRQARPEERQEPPAAGKWYGAWGRRYRPSSRIRPATHPSARLPRQRTFRKKHAASTASRLHTVMGRGTRAAGKHAEEFASSRKEEPRGGVASPAWRHAEGEYEAPHQRTARRGTVRARTQPPNVHVQRRQASTAGSMPWYHASRRPPRVQSRQRLVTKHKTIQNRRREGRPVG